MSNENFIYPTDDIMIAKSCNAFKRMAHLLCICTTIFALAFTNSAQAERKASDPDKRMQTIGGVLQVTPLEGDYNSFDNNHLYLNKKKIPAFEVENVELKSKYSIAGNDVILITSYSSGSCCPWTDWYFLTITPKGAASLSDPITVTDDPKIEVGKEKITLITTKVDGRRKKTKTWVYANGNVKEER